MRFVFISENRKTFLITAMCRVLRVSRSGYYAWRRRPISPSRQQNEALAVEIRRVHRENRRCYGSPRIHEQLQDEGVRCGKKRIERVMRENGIRAKQSRRFRRTTDSNHAYPIAPNVLQRRFDAEHPNQVWASDITYIATREGWLYLAVVLDLFSRRVVGWSMKATLSQSLALDALRMALMQRTPPRGLVHHSDRGVQYASRAYQQLLKANGMVCSMSRKGDCWDNAVVESFFRTLKLEGMEQPEFKTRRQARLTLFEYMEAYYNRKRLHSTLGYVSPAQFEQAVATPP